MAEPFEHQSTLPAANPLLAVNPLPRPLNPQHQFRPRRRRVETCFKQLSCLLIPAQNFVNTQSSARDHRSSGQILPSSLHSIPSNSNNDILAPTHNDTNTDTMSRRANPERGVRGDAWRLMAFTNGASGNGQSSPYSRKSIAPQHPDWKSYTFVDIFAQELPLDVTTIELYRNLRHYGNINQINIHLNTSGLRSGDATIRFKPPPRIAFWNQSSYFSLERDPDERSSTAIEPTRIRLRLDRKQRINFTVKSPIRAEVKYDQEFILLADSIDFGVLRDPTSMMIMETKTTGKKFQIKMVLNLSRNRPEIEIHFPHVIYSERRTDGQERKYNFCIALDQALSILQTQDAIGQTSYVLSLDSPPPFRRRLQSAIAQSHKKDSLRWFEDDAWTRETDIVRHKSDFEMLEKTPITVRKDFNCIAIGRWNTFRVTIGKQQDDLDARRIFREALQDYNVVIKDIGSFDLERENPPPEPDVWSLLDDVDLNSAQQNLLGGYLLNEWNQIHLAFPVRYQLEVCISHGWLNEYNVDKIFLETLSEMEEQRAKQFLICVASRGKRFFNPMEIFDDLDFKKPVRKPRIPEACVEMYHATVTATNILYNTPSVEMTNRIVRQYKQHADRFLRVRFEDDEYRGNKKIFASESCKMDPIFERVKRTLRHGIKLGGRHYKFLAWGNSQLREHGAYFFASGSNTPTAAQIRAVMGEFDHEKIVAKRAARIGQCFSTTRSIQLRLPRITRDNLIPDIIRNHYTFTDGVGQISPTAAAIAAHQLKIAGPVPSVLQFRLGGCKGVLALSEALKGSEIKIRESQFKFKSNSGELEIIRHSEFWHAYLNRQLILVLSALKVPDEVFLAKQRQEIEVLNRAIKNDTDAINALRDRVDPNRMTLVLSDLVADGFRERGDPFVTSTVELWRAWCLKYLKEKAKLPVPEGAFVLGCVDETATLKGHFEALQPLSDTSEKEKIESLPEIFLQITDPKTGKCRVIEQICAIARNPSLHPGDIRVVKAIDVPKLHHLRDVLVMPQTGDRDLPSMCSGGDLDGDDYVVIWDEKLLPRVWNRPAFHYDPPKPRVACGEITEEDFIAFFHDYMRSDFLGRIAHAHLSWADYLDDGIEDDTCMALVQLHSMAVDYPKTGVPAVMERNLRPQSWPHFMEKNAKTHRSHKILGRLFDQVERVSFTPSYRGTFDERVLKAHTPSLRLMVSAQNLKYEYDRAMQRIMAQHNIKTEFEVWTTFVLDHSKAKGEYKFHEEIGQLSKSLKDQFYESIVEIVGGRDYDKLAPFAVAAYKITQGEVAAALREVDLDERCLDAASMPFITFPWILHEVLGKIATSFDQITSENSIFSVIDDGEIVTGSSTTAQEFDKSGNSVIEVTSSDVPWAGKQLTGTHFDRRFPDPYQPIPTTDKMETEPASTDITENLVHIPQDSSVMHSEVNSLPSTAAGSPIDLDNHASETDATLDSGNIDSKIHSKMIKSSNSISPALFNDLISLANSPGTSPDVKRPLAIRTSKLEPKDLPKSTAGVYDEDGIYRSPYRRSRNGQSGSPLGGYQRRGSEQMSSLSPLSASTASPIATIAMKEETKCQSRFEEASAPSGTSSANQLQGDKQMSAVLASTGLQSNTTALYREVDDGCRVFADPASGGGFMAGFEPPEEGDW